MTAVDKWIAFQRMGGDKKFILAYELAVNGYF